MEILQKDDGKKGKFYIEREGSTVAEMTYVWAGTDRIIIDHTEVGEVFKDQGVGKQMVSSAVDFARKKGTAPAPRPRRRGRASRRRARSFPARWQRRRRGGLRLAPAR